MLSGYVSVPRWRLFWQKGSETYNSFVADAMSRNRFEIIKRYLHCSDNDCLDQADKYSKVRPFFAMLNEQFLIYSKVLLDQELSVDESMVPYFGKHGFKQYTIHKGETCEICMKNMVSLYCTRISRTI